MQAKSILTAAALLIAALFILDVPAANAGHSYTWTGLDKTNPTYWNDADNWSSGTGTQYPGSDPKDLTDTATIGNVANDPDLNVSVTIGALTVSSGGVLDILAGYTLTITGSQSTTQYIDGTINLQGSGSTLAFTTNNQTLSYSSTPGTLDGQNDSAQITIAASKTLTNEITIAGAMEIWAGSGTFINGATGLVHANRTSGGQILTLYSGTFDDVDGAEWKVSGHAAAELYFRAGITVGTLDGDFTVSNGILDLDVSVTTNGGLCFTGGQIQVANGCTFTVNGVHPSCP